MVDLLGDDAALGEDGLHLLRGGVEGEVGDVDGGVFALAGLGRGFDLFGGEGGAPTFVLSGGIESERQRWANRVWSGERWGSRDGGCEREKTHVLAVDILLLPLLLRRQCRFGFVHAFHPVCLALLLEERIV